MISRVIHISAWLAAGVYALSPFAVAAQGLTPDPFTSGGQIFSGISSAAVLGIIRFILVTALLISAMVAYRSGYNWIYWEGNAKKALENKRSLSNALLLITGLFILLAFLKVFVGDYSSLVF